MAGLTKIILYKSLRRSRSSVEQLKESLLETEVILNHPLGYLEDGTQLPALTPIMLIHGTNISLPDEIVDDNPDFKSPTLPRMLKNLNCCKNHGQTQNEYVSSASFSVKKCWPPWLTDSKFLILDGLKQS